MRLSPITSVAFLMMAIAALQTSPATAGEPCDDVLAKAWTAPVDETTEVGEIAGLLNGAIYMRYEVEDPALQTRPSGKPNVVITTKTGNLYLWMSIKSVEQPDGAYVRAMRTLRALGTGEFYGASINIAIDGEYYPEKEGNYEVLGAICRPTIKLAG